MSFKGLHGAYAANMNFSSKPWDIVCLLDFFLSRHITCRSSNYGFLSASWFIGTQLHLLIYILTDFLLLQQIGGAVIGLGKPEIWTSIESAYWPKRREKRGWGKQQRNCCHASGWWCKLSEIDLTIDSIRFIEYRIGAICRREKIRKGSTMST